MSDEAKQPPANKAMHLTALRAAGDRQSVGLTRRECVAMRKQER